MNQKINLNKGPRVSISNKNGSARDRPTRNYHIIDFDNWTPSQEATFRAKVLREGGEVLQ